MAILWIFDPYWKPVAPLELSNPILRLKPYYFNALFIIFNFHITLWAKS